MLFLVLIFKNSIFKVPVGYPRVLGRESGIVGYHLFRDGTGSGTKNFPIFPTGIRVSGGSMLA